MTALSFCAHPSGLHTATQKLASQPYIALSPKYMTVAAAPQPSPPSFYLISSSFDDSDGIVGDEP